MAETKEKGTRAVSIIKSDFIAYNDIYEAYRKKCEAENKGYINRQNFLKEVFNAGLPIVKDNFLGN